MGLCCIAAGQLRYKALRACVKLTVFCHKHKNVCLAGCSMSESRDTWLCWDTVWPHIFLSWSENDWENWPPASCQTPLSGSAGFSGTWAFLVSGERFSSPSCMSTFMSFKVDRMIDIKLNNRTMGLFVCFYTVIIIWCKPF